MTDCENIKTRLALYLDEELQDDEIRILEVHLKSCRSCRSAVSNERMFLNAVRNARPLQAAPKHLRKKVEQLLDETPHSLTAPASLRRRVRQLVHQPDSKSTGFLNSWFTVTAAVAVIVSLPVVIWLVSKTHNPNHISSFALVAAENHLRHARGQLPLEVVSDDPGQISDWFSNKVKFSVRLPNYQESSGQDKVYVLEGARLIGYDDDYAAFVAYRMGRNPISLVITSEQVARSSGGEEITAKGLVFHYNVIQGLKVITWSDRGLTYALVSDLAERGQQSCAVCHQGTKDQDFIEPLKPR